MLGVELRVFRKAEKDKMLGTLDCMPMEVVRSPRVEHDWLPTLEKSRPSPAHFAGPAVFCHRYKNNIVSFQKRIPQRAEIKRLWNIDHGMLLLLFANLR